MKKMIIVAMLLCTPSAYAQQQFTTAPAVAPTTGVPTEAEIDNAYGICQAHRFKNTWQPGYESCDAVQKVMNARVDESHHQTVLDVARRLK